MPRTALPRARPWGALVVVTVLLGAGCTTEPAPSAPSATASPPPTVPAGPTFEQAVASLTPALVPTGEVRTCEELVPGSPEAQEHLDRVAEELAAGTAEEAAAAPTPSLPTCGNPTVEDLRAGSITGFAHAPGAEVVLPVAGGAARVVEVYELADAEAAAATYAGQVADPEGWAADQEIPEAALEGGSNTPRRVISGARVAQADVPGWSATVLSRDEAGFARDGSPSSAPVSYAYLWGVRGPLVLRVQVAADVPGAAGLSAATTAQAFAAALDAAG